MILPAPTALVLDETPLSLLTQKTGHAQGDLCKAWYARLLNPTALSQADWTPVVD